MKKRDQQRIRKQLHELLDIFISCNGLEERTQEKTGNMPTMFFELSGHVAKARVDIHTDGWFPYAECERFEFYFDRDSAGLAEKVEEIRKTAEEAMKKGDNNDTV